MDEETVLAAHFQRNLADCLKKRLGFDITDGAADLRDHHVRAGLLSHTINEIFDLVGDVRDDLYGGSQILAASLLVEHIPIDLTGCQVGVFVQVFVDETLIMSKIQVSFSAVLCYINFSVLVGTHSARIHIDIRIQLLGCHFQAACL